MKKIILITTALLMFSCYLFEPYPGPSDYIEFNNASSQIVTVSYNNEIFSLQPEEYITKNAVYKEEIREEVFSYTPEDLDYRCDNAIYGIIFTDKQ